MIEKKEFGVLMARLRAHYQNGITDQGLWIATVDTYWRELKNLEENALRGAFTIAWKRHPEWMPSCGQIYALATPSAHERAENAWAEVISLAKRSSGNHSDPIARQAIAQMGGGAALGRWTLQELEKWGKKEFFALYAEISSYRQRDSAQVSAGQTLQIGE